MKKFLAVLLFLGAAAAARAQSWTPYYLGWYTYSGGGAEVSGTVTSINLSCIPELTCSGGPITDSGSITLSWNSVASGRFLARDFSGAGVPSFQALTITDGQCLGRSGTAWASLACSGGGGAVATDTIWDAKGDIVAGTGANTAAIISAGANDTILMWDSAAANGIKAAAVATTSEIADVSTVEAAGTSDTYARGDHVHAIAADTVTNAKLDNMAASTVKANLTTASANPTDATVSELWNMIANPTKQVVCMSDFFKPSEACFASVQTGTGAASNSVNDPSGQQGAVSMSTGTTATGRAAQVANGNTDAGSMLCTNGAGIVAFTMRLEDVSTAGVEDYDYWGGMLREVSAEPTYGLYFKYDVDTSANWYTCSANAGSRTCTDTGTAASADTTYRMRIIWNASCSSADFYINETLENTHSTNMPTAHMTPGVAILKEAGTTARLVYVDYYYLVQILTTAR